MKKSNKINNQEKICSIFIYRMNDVMKMTRAQNEGKASSFLIWLTDKAKNPKNDDRLSSDKFWTRISMEEIRWSEKLTPNLFYFSGENISAIFEFDTIISFQNHFVSIET